MIAELRASACAHAQPRYQGMRRAWRTVNEAAGAAGAARVGAGAAAYRRLVRPQAAGCAAVGAVGASRAAMMSERGVARGSRAARRRLLASRPARA